MFAGQVMVSVGGAEATMVTATLTVTDWFPLTTRNEVVYGCACTAKPDVWNVSVSVPLFVPLVGDTVTHPPAGGTTDHMRAPAPVFFTCTVREGALVPAFVCTLTDVGVTESVCASAAAETSSAPQQSRRNLAARNRRGSVSMAFPGSLNCFSDSAAGQASRFLMAIQQRGLP